MRRSLVVGLLLVCAADANDYQRKMDVWPGGGFFAQVVDSSEWRTTFYLTNLDTKTLYVGLVFFDDLGESMRLPIAGGTAASVGVTLEPGRSAVLATDGVGPLKQGWATVMTCDTRCTSPGASIIRGKVCAAAVFRQSVPGRQDSEAVVPLEVPDAPVVLLFDNRAGYSTGLAMLNGSSASRTYTIKVMDADGSILVEDSVSIPSGQKRVFVLADRYRATAGRNGHMTISGASVIAMGLRFSPNGSFTSFHGMTVMEGFVFSPSAQ